VTLPQDLIICGAAFVAGAVNSVAGGGTLLSFPALMGVGVASTIANATNSAALAPGSFASFYGYRKEIFGVRHLLPALTLVSVAGSALGALLLLRTPTPLFDKLVPFLVLAATLLFAFQDKLKKLGKRPASPDHLERLSLPVAAFLFVVAVYGGYFGAGIGILTLAALGMIGMTEIHRMNGLKALFAGVINLVAAVTLFLAHKVDLHAFWVMSVGAILGGWLGAGGARKVGAGNVRKLVIVIGVGLSLQTIWKFWLHG